MTIVALAGDATTTTALALFGAWPSPATPRGPIPVVVEADPSGGSLAAWLDTAVMPSLSAVVAALHSDHDDGGLGGAWATIDPFVRRAASGVRFIPAPYRASEARGAVEQAAADLFPALAQSDEVVALLDLGRIDATRPPEGLRYASVVLICHRQETSSPAAATVRLERLAEAVTTCSSIAPTAVDVVLIGGVPFGHGEVGPFVGARCHELAVDPLAAAVFGGRQGVSAKRLSRLPLVRTASQLAEEIADRSTASSRDATGARRPEEASA
jgi:hypothetical protein